MVAWRERLRDDERGTQRALGEREKRSWTRAWLAQPNDRRHTQTNTMYVEDEGCTQVPVRISS
jgi:hypothetical protein